MRFLTKRLLSVVLALCLCLTVLPPFSIKVGAAYENTHTNTGNHRADIIAVAKTQLGYTEGTSGYTKYGDWWGLPNADWCAIFVSWCARQAGIPSDILRNASLASPSSDSYCFNIPCYPGSSYTPQPGDLFFTKSRSHVGLVYYTDGAYFYTIEGNASNMVKSNRYLISDYDFGVPNYDEQERNNKMKIWFSDSAMGSKINTINTGEWIYLCYELYDEYTGDLLDTYNSEEYTAKLTIYEPDGSVAHTYSYSNDNNWISIKRSTPGTYSGELEFTWAKGGTAKVTNSITMTASTYSVTYNANGGSGAPSNQTKNYGTALTLSSTIPTRFGYNFVGWATSSSATSASYQPGGSYSSNSNVTLYAVWQQATSLSTTTSTSATATINYGGVGKYYKFTPSVTTSYRIYGTGSVDNKVVLYNSSGTQLATDDDSGEGTQFQLDHTLTAGQTYYIYVRLYSSSNTGSVPFSISRGFTVTYNANNGSGAPDSAYKYYGTALTLSSTRPTRSGYTFLGWATSSSATSAAYQPGGSFTTNANTTLYAVWKANTYTVSYNANGGSGAPGSQTKTHGTTLTLSSTRPTRSGYTFLGWATSSTATSAAYQPGGSFTTNANTTLYAVWKKGCEGGSHSYNYTTTKAPTTSATGTLTGTCSKCSGTTTVTLPKLDTTSYTYSVTKAATCTASGTGRYTWKTTSYGNFYFTATINSLGHNYSSGSCTRCGATDPNYVTNQNSPQIVVSQVSASAGSDVDVAVAMKNNPGINTFTLKIQYDTSRLQLTGVTMASSLGGSYMFADTTATLTWLATADTSFNGSAFTLHFTVLDNAAEGDATVAITYQPGNICNYDEENVDFTVVAGCVSVQDYLPGDINGDGVVNNKDLNRLMKYLTDNSTTVVTAALDVTGDGTVNNKDLNRLMKYLTDNTVQIH